MSLLLEIDPRDFGLPDKFAEFRPIQAEAVDQALSSEKDINALCMGTGSGKSLTAWTVAKVLEKKSVYLTATKGLQDQIQAEFKSCGVVDIRGRGNYKCSRFSHYRCDKGEEHGCSLSATPACPYNSKVEEAKTSDLITTNYSYWLHARRNSPAALATDIRSVELLICDEAHHIFEELGRFLTVEIDRDEWEGQNFSPGSSGLMSESTGNHWKEWAKIRKQDVVREMRDMILVDSGARKDPEYTRLDNLKKKLTEIERMDNGWVWETSSSITSEKVSFEPIWPGRYSNLIWSNVPKVLLISATLRPYTLKLLGLSKDRYDFRESPAVFPPQRGPVYYWPITKLSFKSDEEDYKKICAAVDQIIESRRDRKGIIHTVSYGRMRQVLKYSKYSRYMIFNENSSSVNDVAERFRKSKSPSILVSPSFPTGWDFPGDQCEYQIIIKVPFPYSESRVMKERCKEDEFRVYCAMQELVQMIGRGRRFPLDRCENFILDSNFSFLFFRGRKYAPSFFKPHTIRDLPKAPVKL